MDMAIKAAGETNPGRVRQNNEDAFFPNRTNGAIDPAGPARNGQLFIVADGVGGNRGGARASEIAVTRLPAFFYAATNGDTGKMLRQALDSVAHEIVTEASANPDRANMSCTVVAAVVKDGQAIIAHMGDARAYLLRAGALTQLTRDDTWVQMQVDKGTLTEAEAAAHPDRNIITKSLGNPSFPEPTVKPPVALQPGDRLLLCSDGLSGVATDAEMAAIMSKAPDPVAAVRPLIDLANRKGGPDNVTAVVVQVGQAAPPPGPSRAPLLLSLVVLAAVMVGAFFLFRPPASSGEGTSVADRTATVGEGLPAGTGPAGDPEATPNASTSTVMAAITQASETPTMTATLTPAATTAAKATSTITPVPTIGISPLPPTGLAPLVIEFPPVCSSNTPPQYNGQFRWSWSGQVQAENYLEVRVNEVTQGKVPPSVWPQTPGQWVYSLSADQFPQPQDDGYYTWQVFYMGPGGRELLRSDSGCFLVSRGGGGEGGGAVTATATPETPTPDPDSDGDGIPDDKDDCPDKNPESNPDPNRPGCPAP